MKVPSGKIVYIKRRKFVEGDELPGNVMFSMPEMTKKEADNMPEKKPAKPRRTHPAARRFALQAGG